MFMTVNQANTIEVDIHINPDELQRAYQGVESIHAYSTDGRSIRFPVKVLWSFIGHDGIHGRFSIEFDKYHKFKSVIRIA